MQKLVNITNMKARVGLSILIHKGWEGRSLGPIEQVESLVTIPDRVNEAKGLGCM